MSSEKDTLLWLSLNFKPSLFKIIDALSQVLSTTGISEFQKQTIRETLHNAKYLLKTGNILQEKLEKQAD